MLKGKQIKVTLYRARLKGHFTRAQTESPQSNIRATFGPPNLLVILIYWRWKAEHATEGLVFILTTLPLRLALIKFPTLTSTAAILASKSHIRFLPVYLNQGDSGGALVCNGILAGAASWGSALCEPSFGIPYVYTRISYYYDWIIQQWAWRPLYRMFSSYVLWHTACGLGFIRKIMSESSILESMNEAGYKNKIMCKWKIRRFAPFSRPNKEYINEVQQSFCCSLEQIDFTDH